MQIKYVDENSLKHSHYIGPGPGNRWRSDVGNKGQFGTAPRTERINRYQYRTTDEEGNTSYHYTSAGEKRKAYEESVNAGKSKKNRLDEDAVYDTDRWVRDDYKNMADTARNISEAAKGTSNMIDMFNVPKNKKRIDLSEMTDEELRNILNRERMEREYQSYFNQPEKNKGAEYTKKFMDTVSWAGQQAATAMQIVSIVRSFR